MNAKNAQEENKNTVRRFFSCFNSKDPEGLAALLAESLDWWIIGDTKVSGHKDKRTIVLGLKFIHRVYAGFAFQLGQLTAEEDRVSAIAESQGRHKSGKEYHNHYHFLFTFDRDGRILAVKEYMDTRHAAWIDAG